MNFMPSIQAFCCHYTSQQSCTTEGGELAHDGFPANVTVHRVVCSGKLQVSTLLQAFEEGADGVYVVGCPADQCHNLQGSRRAAKRIGAVKKALAELGVEPERAEMFHLARGLHPEFIATAQKMSNLIQKLGPCPLKGEPK